MPFLVLCLIQLGLGYLTYRIEHKYRVWLTKLCQCYSCHYSPGLLILRGAIFNMVQRLKKTCEKFYIERKQISWHQQPYMCKRPLEKGSSGPSQDPKSRLWIILSLIILWEIENKYLRCCKFVYSKISWEIINYYCLCKLLVIQQQISNTDF